ncbi:hypothetical protein [Methylorubrum extorquens]
MPLRKSFVIAGRLWRWFANAAGFLLIAVGVSYAIVALAAGEGEVITASNIRPQVDKTAVGGSISYVYNLDIHEECPGEIVQVWTAVRANVRESTLVQARRPAAYTGVGYYDDLRIVTDLPPSVTPGRWRYQSSRDSRCPTRQRTDPIADFFIEVTP